MLKEGDNLGILTKHKAHQDLQWPSYEQDNYKSCYVYLQSEKCSCWCRDGLLACYAQLRSDLLKGRHDGEN